MAKANQAGKATDDKYRQQEEELERMKEEINSPAQAEDNSTQAEGEEAPESESAPDEENPAEEAEETTPDGESESEESDDQKQEPAPKPSKKAENRYRSLAERMKKAEEEARRANDLLKQYVYGQPQQASVEQTQSEDGYLTMDEVVRQVQNATRQTIEQEREAARNERRWELWREDAGYLEEKYPILNGRSPEFDEEFFKSLTGDFAEMFKTNRDLRLKDFTEKRIKQAEKLAEKLKAQAADMIRKQASEQAIGSGDAPTPSKQSIDEMIANVKTEEDLEAIKHQIGYRE